MNDADRQLILAADNEQDILDLVTYRLEREGYEVVTAKDGEAARALLEERRPDLAMLDVGMPKLNGYEVARWIRSSEQLSGIPIIMLSASIKERDVARSLAAGANQHLRKPFSPRELVEVVRSLLAGEATGSSGEGGGGRYTPGPSEPPSQNE